MLAGQDERSDAQYYTRDGDWVDRSVAVEALSTHREVNAIAKASRPDQKALRVASTSRAQKAITVLRSTKGLTLSITTNKIPMLVVKPHGPHKAFFAHTGIVVGDRIKTVPVSELGVVPRITPRYRADWQQECCLPLLKSVKKKIGKQVEILAPFILAKKP